MTGLFAVAAAAGAAALLLPGAVVNRRPVGSPGHTRAAALAGLGGGIASIALLDGRRVVLAVLGLVAAVAVSREVARRRRRLVADRRAEQVLAMCEALASDLRAGQPPLAALTAAAEDWPELAPVAAAAALGADVPTALRDLGRRPGAGQVRIVAAAWQVAHRSGAGLSGALAMAAERLRSERATARVVATEMAAAQATARLLAVMPVGVLLLGSGLGGDPFGFLLDTTAGLVCLCSGLALEYAGLSWLTRIADHVLGRR